MKSRHNFYREIHKGIRVMLSDLVASSGRVDWTDTLQVSSFKQELRSAFATLSEHAENEGKFIDPLLQACDPSVYGILSEAHEDQERLMDEMLVTADRIDSSSPDAPFAGHTLVVQLSRFVGELLTHMADEEEFAMTALWNAHDDGVLMQVHNAILASLPPEKSAHALRMMIPAVNQSERVAMLAGMRAHAPEPVFAGARAIAAAVLSPEDNAALDRSLNQ